VSLVGGVACRVGVVGTAPLDYGRGHLVEYNKTDMIFTNPPSEVTDPRRQRALRLMAAAEVRQPRGAR
jgi:hypothetical protein